VILLWDGLASHRSAQMKQVLAEQRRWLEVRRLPGYAPELNPAEGLWSSLKSCELANRCDTMVSPPAYAARLGVDCVRSSRELPFSFLRHAGLPL
jgi:DDE superfamily endonuclease